MVSKARYSREERLTVTCSLSPQWDAAPWLLRKGDWSKHSTNDFTHPLCHPTLTPWGKSFGSFHLLSLFFLDPVSIFYLFFILFKNCIHLSWQCASTHLHICHSMHVEIREQSAGDGSLLPLRVWIPGIKLNTPELAENIVTHWAVVPGHFSQSFLPSAYCTVSRATFVPQPFPTLLSLLPISPLCSQR